MVFSEAADAHSSINSPAPQGVISGYNTTVCGGCGHFASALMLTVLLNNAPDVVAKATRWESEVRSVCVWWWWGGAQCRVTAFAPRGSENAAW